MAGSYLVRNALAMQALGIRSITFSFYRDCKSHWKVTLETGESFNVAVPNLATETTVLRRSAEKLAEMGRAVNWPEGSSVVNGRRQQ